MAFSFEQKYSLTGLTTGEKINLFVILHKYHKNTIQLKKEVLLEKFTDEEYDHNNGNLRIFVMNSTHPIYFHSRVKDKLTEYYEKLIKLRKEGQQVNSDDLDEVQNYCVIAKAKGLL